MGASPDDVVAEAHRLILEAATGARRPPPDELQRVLERVARAGFDPHARERVRGRLAVTIWQGRTLMGRDQLPPAEAHYLWHVVKRRGWPSGTSLEAYLESIRAVVSERTNGVFTSQYQGASQFGVIRPSGPLRGSGGFG